MTNEQLKALLSAVDAKKEAEGWMEAQNSRTLTLYAAYSGASLTVGRIEAVKTEGDLLFARTNKGELYVLLSKDIFAGAAEGTSKQTRKAGFV